MSTTLDALADYFAAKAVLGAASSAYMLDVSNKSLFVACANAENDARNAWDIYNSALESCDKEEL